MAKMYPRQLPDQVLNDPILKGEVQTHEALSKLSDEFEVFYNRTTSAKTGSGAYARPIDFIVLHERLGLLAIEVKGGRIRIGKDGSIEQYQYSPQRWEQVFPYAQVRTAIIELIKNCKGDGANHWIPADTCVIFPNTLRRNITDTTSVLPPGTLCEDDLPIIVTQIKTLFSTPTRGELAWTRDAFLDMRRRLQNMSEVTSSRVQITKKKTFKKRFGKVLPETKTAETISVFQIDDSLKEYYESEYVEENVARTLSGRGQANDYSSVYTRTSSPQIQHVSLKLWQIALAIIIGLLVSLAYVWFLPNLSLHRLF